MQFQFSLYICGKLSTKYNFYVYFIQPSPRSKVVTFKLQETKQLEIKKLGTDKSKM